MEELTKLPYPPRQCTLGAPTLSRRRSASVPSMKGKMKSGKWISLALLACGLVLLTSGCSCLQLAHAPYPNVEYELANKPSQEEARGAAD